MNMQKKMIFSEDREPDNMMAYNDLTIETVIDFKYLRNFCGAGSSYLAKICQLAQKAVNGVIRKIRLVKLISWGPSTLSLPCRTW